MNAARAPISSRLPLALLLTALLLLAAGGIISGGVVPAAQAQTTYTVTNAGGSGAGSLRAAIRSANDDSGTPPDTIAFDISGSASPSSPHVIRPDSALPVVTDPVVIDGTSEPGYNSGAGAGGPKPVVEIDGTNVGDTDGIELRADGNTVRGLAVVNFGRFGLLVGDSAAGQTIVGCHVGVRADGTTPAGNGRDGIRVNEGSSTIGGTEPDDGNIIGSNGGDGLILFGDNHIVQGNFIGTNPGGKDLGNGKNGVKIGGGAQVSIGGTSPGEANVIAFNNRSGVLLLEFSIVITIRGNRIFDNGGLGIDLGGAELGNGRTANDDTPADSADDDNGPNRLQNFPVIESSSYDAGAGEVTVTYRVDSEPGLSSSGASTYPLMVDFYRADTTAGDREGEAYLHTDTYTASDHNGGPSKTITFTPDTSVSASNKLVATATGDAGNTSEFSGVSSQLPVELAFFEAARSGRRAVRLTWQTASEQGSAGFEVQRRVEDATGAGQKEDSWVQVGYVESKASGGTTTEDKSYEYVATGLPVGTHQFRLKQVDLDGSSSLTDPVSVDIRMQEAVSLKAPAPNPASGTATVSFAVKERAETTIRLYNSLGQRVRAVYEGTPQTGERQTARIDVGGLPSGTYFLRLRAGDQTRTQRLTVVR
ncbi:MAG: T9SS type A sorting domain-containing protein [Salinibacter sp.]|uniref:T9SS type A sorting domain-containing protein n=1 Tax=Salinibacter sp. TaxID=2065818 RepID=UPI0035D48EF2